MNVFLCDVTHDKLTTQIREESVDIVTIIFVMSGISPEKMLLAVENIAAVSGKYIPSVVSKEAESTLYSLSI